LCGCVIITIGSISFLSHNSCTGIKRRRPENASTILYTWAFGVLEQDLEFFWNVLFGDEVMSLSRYNCYYWSLVNPHWYRQIFYQHRWTLHVWGRGSFGHGSIGHHQPQQPVLRGFPLFKRCEWLVFNRFVSKRRPPHVWVGIW